LNAQGLFRLRLLPFHSGNAIVNARSIARVQWNFFLLYCGAELLENWIWMSLALESASIERAAIKEAFVGANALQKEENKRFKTLTRKREEKKGFFLVRHRRISPSSTLILLSRKVGRCSCPS
jgi:hypothetical protein